MKKCSWLYCYFCIIYYDTIILFVFHIHVVLRTFNKVRNSSAACVCTIISVTKRKKTFHLVPIRHQHIKFVASQDFVLGKSDCVTTYKIKIFSTFSWCWPTISILPVLAMVQRLFSSLAPSSIATMILWVTQRDNEWE